MTGSVGRLTAIILFIAMVAALSACGQMGEERGDRLRLGYFPNVSHAQAVIGVARGDFERALGEEIEFESTIVNAGPLIVEAIFAGHLDMAYVGPAPALTGHLRSRGEEIRVVAGGAENGVLVVGSKGRGITSLDQLGDARVATPSIGNTQDISAKRYVTQVLGSRLHTRGGSAQVIPIPNPDIYNLFRQNQLDAAWLPEPWGSRLIEAGYVVLIAEEKDLWPEGRLEMTCVIVRRDYLEKYPENVRKFLEAHVTLTRELQEDPFALSGLLQEELARLTGQELPMPVIESSLRYINFTEEMHTESFETFVQWGRELDIYRMETTALDRLFYPAILDDILAGPPDAARKAAALP